ncbi:hypothetical protein FA95DRAFT_1607870 [Auriscalpium vulgare]|uniref:Uncharacterized protein n=1 Tax=Auriscalpium vulgare TaxID=40419 RepID=A0ACB8RM37_9AGAM|nr:hypothetical protein FA95DRAFT_1607870 [Auriscalpium vulgare]
MSYKQELETWAAALKCYDDEDLLQSLEIFSSIADNSKTLTNMGLICATIGDHELAVEHFMNAIRCDSFLAVAYFQCGVSNFLIGRYESALKDFDDAMLFMRGNSNINYTQLGLPFILYNCEILFNKGLTLINLGNEQDGLADMREAASLKVKEDHFVIDEAIQDRGNGYTVFSIPMGVLYRPSAAKMKNRHARNYLGNALLVAADDSSDAFTTFTGITRLKQGISPRNIFVDSTPIEGSSLTRSVTAPAPRMPKGPDVDVELGARGLGRANTLDVPSTLKPGPSVPPSPSSFGGGPPPSSFIAPSAPQSVAGGSRLVRNDSGLSRNNSGLVRKKSALTRNTGALARNNSAMSRSTSARRANAAPWTRAREPVVNQDIIAPTPRQTARGEADVSDFYDSYMDNYADGQLMRAGSAYGGSQRAGTVRRQGSRRAAPPPSAYIDEEGYVSGGEYEGGYELMKIRVKIHCADEMRGMAIDPTMPFAEFIQRVADKFDSTPSALVLQFKDAENGRVTLRDAGDFEFAIETAREHADGRPEGKLDLYCMKA